MAKVIPEYFDDPGVNRASSLLTPAQSLAAPAPISNPASPEADQAILMPTDIRDHKSVTTGVHVRSFFGVSADGSRSILDHWWFQYLMGDCHMITNFVNTQRALPRDRIKECCGVPLWYGAWVIDMCRVFGPPAFVNNPWSGILFVIAVGLQNIYILLFGILGMALSAVTAWCLNVGRIRMHNGVAYFNGFLIGMLVGATGSQRENHLALFIFPVAFYGCMSAFLKVALDAICHVFHIHTMNLPFSILALVHLGSQLATPFVYFSGTGIKWSGDNCTETVENNRTNVSGWTNMSDWTGATEPMYTVSPQSVFEQSPEHEVTKAEKGQAKSMYIGKQEQRMRRKNVDFLPQWLTIRGIWEQVFHGIFYALGEVYFCRNLTSVVLCWVAVFLASPLLFLMTLAGSCIGAGTALALGVDRCLLWSGDYSMNALLVSGSLGGFFYVLNGYSFVVAILGAGFSTCISGFCSHVLQPSHLPFFGLPLFITNSFFLLASSANDTSKRLHRVKQPSTHERNLVNYYTLLQVERRRMTREAEAVRAKISDTRNSWMTAAPG